MARLRGARLNALSNSTLEHQYHNITNIKQLVITIQEYETKKIKTITGTFIIYSIILSVDFSPKDPIIIGCDKSCDIRVIETLICLQSSRWLNIMTSYNALLMAKCFNKLFLAFGNYSQL